MARDNREPRVMPNIDELPELTTKQLLFVEGVLSGKNASDAYRAAYDVADMGSFTINAEASKLRRSPKIDAWIRAGHVAHLAAGIISKEEHVRELGAIREIAKDQGDLKTAVAAEHLRGKVSGFYVERSEVTVYDPAAILAQIANIDPSIAARLAERFNLPLPALLASAQTIDAEDVSPVPDQPLSPSAAPQDEPADDHAGATQGEATR